MPLITTVVYPDRGHVLVEVNFGDVPGADCVLTERVVGGVATPLRAYVYGCPELGEYQHLSGGVAIYWDNEAPLDVPYTYTAQAAGYAPTATSGTVTLPSLGGLWLRDPVRPCNDVRADLCWLGDSQCQPGSGVAFLAQESERYADNSGRQQPLNASRLLGTARLRRDAASGLVLGAKSLESRDALLQLFAPGSPVLVSAPPVYGIPDTYMQVGEVDVARIARDHRIPDRVLTAPYDTVDRPPGPSEGICGARFRDLCDTYASWTAVVAAGLGWSDLLLGAAGDDPPDLGDTWADVAVAHASWTSVATEGTWADVREP